jgi:calcineurin-like phosphoesterase family protein
MSNLWFTSDTHFGHANIIRYCKRPFGSVDEMNEVMIQRWNEVVKHGDFVYHLGDFAFGKNLTTEMISRRLQGSVTVILGNHDDENYLMRLFGGQVCHYLKLKIDNQDIILFHYAMRTWWHDLRGSWHLYGHSHGALPGHGKSFDIGVDCNDFRPQNFDEIKSRMDALSIASGTPTFHCDQCNRFPCECDDEKTA